MGLVWEGSWQVSVPHTGQKCPLSLMSHKSHGLYILSLISNNIGKASLLQISPVFGDLTSTDKLSFTFSFFFFIKLFMGLENRDTLREGGREKLTERNILEKDAKGMFWQDEVLGRGQGLVLRS